MKMSLQQLKQKRKEGVLAILKEVGKIVTPKIEEVLDSNIDDKFKEVVRYQIATGGKNLRSALVLLGCLGCGGKLEDAVYPAAGIEILHNDTLMIDDIIDHSRWRRRKATVWEKYGPSVTQCLSFIYSASVFQAVHRSKNPKAVNERLARALKTVAQGEVNDILMEQNGRGKEKYVQKNRYREVEIEDYLKMISRKTASLIQTASEVGGLCAQATKGRLQALRDYGYNLGVSFQIRDDILDIYGKKAKFGKRIGQDIYEGKLGNILIIYALEELNDKDGASLLNILRKSKKTDKDVSRAIKMIKDTGAKQRAMDLADHYNRQGAESLKKLPGNEYAGILNDLLEFVSVREI